MSRYRDTRIHGRESIATFLRAVDRNLSKATTVVIIGGGAAVFHHATTTTNDIDTYEALSEELETAIERASSETGMVVPVRHSAVAQLPWNFEDRLERQLPELLRLEVWVLEKHDLVLSKTVRGDEHDDQQILEIHRSIGLDFDVLVDRFQTEMGSIVGDLTRIRTQFLQVIELLFGELERVHAEKLLK